MTEHSGHEHRWSRAWEVIDGGTVTTPQRCVSCGEVAGHVHEWRARAGEEHADGSHSITYTCDRCPETTTKRRGK